MSRTGRQLLPGAPMTAGQLDSMKDLVGQLYVALAQACRKSSMTWHAEVRRAFVQERLLLLPKGNAAVNGAVGTGNGRNVGVGTGGVGVGDGRNVGAGNAGNATGRSARDPLRSENRGNRQQRPRRLLAKEAWWDVEEDLAQMKVANLSFRPFYEDVLGISDAEFLFLRVIGLRKRCSRADIAQRLKDSMACPGPLSNWAEGIDITDLEELEDIQTSSYFRPPDWRSPQEPDEPAPPPPPAFQPPPAASGRSADATAGGATGGATGGAVGGSAGGAGAGSGAGPGRSGGPGGGRREELPATSPSNAPSTPRPSPTSKASPRHRFAWREGPQEQVERPAASCTGSST
eukprot:Skav231851  [mRNA]  locus=scaffold2307:14810:16767:+ [translate_table: standard]